MSADVDLATLEQQVQAWIDDDPDATTAQELRDLLGRARTQPEGWEPGQETHDLRVLSVLSDTGAAREELADRFAGTLQFGTAGLRGRLGGGPNRMNRAVVIRAASGLADFLLGETEGAGGPPVVVVGYDARHRSVDFAHDTAAVLTAVGCDVRLLPGPLPTPVLAFAVRHLGADAGVMVTASHNPPQDNGYKVYLGGRVVHGAGQGAQIVPPYDGGIAAAIARVPSVASVPRAASGWTVLGPEVAEAYVASVLGSAPPGRPAADLSIVLTPMHGVGGAIALRVLQAAGFGRVQLVPQQAAPDPDFPTVDFPNPEEPGAIDLSLVLAATVDADLVLALDPDADRCAVALRDPRAALPTAPGTAAADGWRMLHGDETGSLLGAAVAARVAGGEAGGTAWPTGDDPGDAAADGPALASSIVSSRLLGRIAAAHGLRHVQTLTGFKWIARVPGLAFGYEEALGLCVDPAHVRDKDGISAALAVARLAADLAAQGRTLVDALDDLARAHGLHLTDQVSARFTDLDAIGTTMDRVRDQPPTFLGGSPVVETVDLAAGTDDDRGGLPPTAGLRLVAEDGTRVVVRPSGTEPKVKCYLEVVQAVAPDASYEDVSAARERARERLDALADEVRAALGLSA
ncbi:phospho-sugar mutase [Cellulomonas marina]|uniref:Phosphomannomutase n=1 Tax=Cellulomonas marina TaxID=988821 RepID=A0A1I0ZJV5_9CELL|nr:phospho-sugar mutase [Cellulomonas marina]GIG28640.1 phosphomannomutase [Cellulomonas marina]SFB25737.1 phosphomannomutase [Cellulomonas marina]